LLGPKFADIEEKYDLSQVGEGFGEKDAEGEDIAMDEEGGMEQGEEEV
jgi:hypothetical protein